MISPSSTPSSASTKNLVVIPARMKASRLPNKPLADIHGEPMILHVWRRVMQAQAGDVVVACAEEEVAQVVNQAGGLAVMTDPQLPAGTDRVAAAWKSLPNWKEYTAIVNVQGDLPTLDPHIITHTVNSFYATPHGAIMTPVTTIVDTAELHTPSVVKVATGAWSSKNQERQDLCPIARALYFSRSCIPHGAAQYYHHIGLYVLRPDVLENYVNLLPTRLEKEERLEQLRALEAGFPIYVTRVETATPFGVDTPEDLEKARDVLRVF